MARRSALGEIWAWLSGVVLPVGGLATALALVAAPNHPAAPAREPSTSLVAGASASRDAQVPVAATATPSESLASPLLTSPPALAAGGTLGGPGAIEARPRTHSDSQPSPPATSGVAVAGVQLQSDVTPLIGRVGGATVPVALPATALALAVAGFAWRVHTCAPWPSRNRPPPPRVSPRTRSEHA